jgi:hypothetical protein
MECRPHCRGFTRATRFQALSVGKRLRGSRDERALLGCGRARSSPVVKEGSGISLVFRLTGGSVDERLEKVMVDVKIYERVEDRRANITDKPSQRPRKSEFLPASK